MYKRFRADGVIHTHQNMTRHLICVFKDRSTLLKFELNVLQNFTIYRITHSNLFL